MATLAARLGLSALLLVALAGCALPRGAGFQREVLAARQGEDGTPLDFAVQPVTRTALALYDGWPQVGEPGLRWIAGSPESPTRIIAPGDTLNITLWNTEDNPLLASPGQRSINLDGVTVGSGGSIFMPYVGNVAVAGMSPEHAREVIQDRFLEVSPSAQVQLEMTAGRMSAVSLVGGVGAPGAYPMPDQSFTVLSLIAAGGGVQTSLDNPQIRLIRGGDIYGTSVDRLFKEPDLDTTLRGGDKIIVEADPRYFLSLGAAGSESEHRFPRDTVTALEAMSLIGGVSDSRANPKGILVLRRYPQSAVKADGSGPPNSRVVFTLDLTTADGLFSAGQFRILSGDLVYATESPVTTAQTIFGLLGTSLGLTRSIQSTVDAVGG